MFEVFYRLIGNVQMGETTGSTSTSDLGGRQVAMRKQLTFASSVEGGGDHG